MKQTVYQPVVSSDGYALVTVVEIVVVKDHAHGQPLDDEGRQFAALASPLLFGIFLYQNIENILSHQRKRLFLQVLRFTATQGFNGFFPLFRNLGLSLRRSGYAPQTVKGIHVEGQIVEFSLVVRHGRIGVTVEFHNGVHKVPHFLVGGMENVCPVFVYVDSLHLLAVKISSQIGTFVNDQTTLARPSGQMRKGGTHQSRTHNQIIILFLALHRVFA